MMTPEQTLSHLSFFQQVMPIAVAIGIAALFIGVVAFAIASPSSPINQPAIIISVACCVVFAGAWYIMDNSNLTSAQRKSLQSSPSKIVSTKTIQLVQMPNKKQPMFYDNSKSKISYWTSSGNQSHLNTVPKKAKVKFVSLGETNQSANTLVIEESQYLDQKVDKLLQYEDNAHDTYVFVDSSK